MALVNMLAVAVLLLDTLSEIEVVSGTYLPEARKHVNSRRQTAGEVDAAIAHLELHYTEKLCLELLLVDCSKHVTVGDEQVCGSNGITYANHCLFTHAVCEYRSASPPLTLASHGACPTSTTVPTTTVDPLSSIVQNVFCRNVNHINCGVDPDIQCGSDGNLYVNACEMSKAKCSDPTLHVETDTSKCH